MRDILKRLRELARNEHDDHSIGDEAADAIEALTGASERVLLAIDWSQTDDRLRLDEMANKLRDALER